MTEYESLVSKAKQGDIDAQTKLGGMFHEGYGVEIADEPARRLFQLGLVQPGDLADVIFIEAVLIQPLGINGYGYAGGKEQQGNADDKQYPGETGK